MVDSYYPGKVFRFCPRCGSPEFNPENVKSLKCRECGFLYFINPVSAVTALIFDDEKRLLLTRRRHEPARGMLDLPGGFVDQGEKGEDALIREIREELNLTIDQYYFFGTFPNEYLFEGIVYFTLDIVFICKISNLNTLKPADDVTSCEFTPPEMINPDEIGLMSVKNIIQSYQLSLKNDSAPT
jgi:NAD+ diphosphatase